MDSQVPERRGKSWKRDREDRGRRQEKVVEEKKEEVNDEEEEETKNTEEGAVAEDDEEKKRLEEERALELKEEGRKQLMDFIADTEDRLHAKNELRQRNRDAAQNRPDESHFTKLDSSVKKNTAFVRKLKTFTENQKDSLMKDMASLNLTKYVSEVAAAIVEAKLKMSDISAVVSLCSALHMKYGDFAGHLLDNWQKALTLKKEDKIHNPSKLRVDLRFYGELISAGVFTQKEGLPLLGNVLTNLVNTDKEDHHNLPILLSFCRHCGDDYAGLSPRKYRLLSEEHGMHLPKSDLLTVERQRNVRQLLRDYYVSLSKHLVKEYRELQNFERQNYRMLRAKGELTTERKDHAEQLQASYQKLHANTLQFSEMLDEDMPDLPEDEVAKHEEAQIRMDEGEIEVENGIGTLVWDDDDTRCFYESLPDLKAFLPSILYKDSAQQPVASSQEKEEEQLDEDLEIDDLEAELKPEESDAKKEEEILPPDIEEFEEPETNMSASNKIMLDAFITHLPKCINREMIDTAAVEFVMNLNTKHNRRKLVKTLFSVPRTRLDLLPFYGRLVAILYPCMPDVATDLAQLLKQDFKYHVKKKDQINIESKIKVVRFMGEMVKFRMFSKSEALYCLKLLLHDFRHHHIEMACNLLETCGRFLFHSPEAHHRMKVFLEVIMRKKSATAMDSRYVTMIENAYYYVNPPDVIPGAGKKERPPMHEYIRKLLYRDLAKSNTEKVLRQMRKLDWEDPEIRAYAVKCLINVWNVKFYNVRCMASLLAGLVTYQEFIGLQVVDGVLEDIRLGMEVNHAKFSQRRIAMVKYLGELYNYRLVESAVIFQILYSFIVFGVSMDLNCPSELDPPDSLFRVRMTCVLLETCGQYFHSGLSKKKLDYFFTFFQAYYWWKRSLPLWNEDNPFPISIEYLVKDTLVSLRPKLRLFKNYEEAHTALLNLEVECFEKILEVVPSMKQKLGIVEEEHDDDLDDGLATILEGEEAEDDDEARSDLDDAPDEAEWENAGESLSQSQHSQPLHVMDDNMEDNSATQGDELTGEGVVDMKDDFTVPGAPKHINCCEDDDFMTAFDKMVSENIQDRLRESVRTQQVDIAVPVHIKSGQKKSFEQLQETEESTTVNFVLMMRKGNKQQYKNLAVPLQSELAQNLKNREEAERAEKERVKRLTLDINERLEEEDYQEMQAQAQKPLVMNLNRERRPKYQHPKGAPDADLIFGPKKDKNKNPYPETPDPESITNTKEVKISKVRHYTEEEKKLMARFGKNVYTS